MWTVPESMVRNQGVVWTTMALNPKIFPEFLRYVCILYIYMSCIHRQTCTTMRDGSWYHRWYRGQPVECTKVANSRVSCSIAMVPRPLSHHCQSVSQSLLYIYHFRYTDPTNMINWSDDICHATYIYIHIYIYTYTYICAYICAYIYIYIHV